MAGEPLIRNISDTAIWVAMYRAMESERNDPLFRDPLARRLAGARGEQILAAMPWSNKHAWSYTARTYLVDTLVEQGIRAGAGMIVNLAAGLDARPYRMALPSTLQWVEVDLPDLLAYKEDVLRDERPACKLERIALDLSDRSGRQALFSGLGRRARQAMILSEGLLIYLSAGEVRELGRDLAAAPSFARWATDLVSPGLLKMLQKRIGASLGQAGAPLKFGPSEGPGFFTSCGWKPVEVRSMFRTAANLKRLPFPLRIFSFLPDTKPGGNRPWGGVCLLEKHAG